MKPSGKSVKPADSKPVVKERAAPPAAPNGGRVGVLAQRSGPLPDAAEMEYYREKSPEVYRAIVSEFEANGEHRREMNRRSQSLDEVVVPELLRQDRLGIYFSFGIALAAMTAVTIAGIMGSTSAAIGTAIPAVMMSIPGIIRATKRRQDAPDDGKDDSP